MKRFQEASIRLSSRPPIIGSVTKEKKKNTLNDKNPMTRNGILGALAKGTFRR